MKQNVEKAMERFNAAGKDAPQGWPPPAEGQTIHVPDLPAPPGLCWQQNPEGLMEYCTFPAGHAGRHQWERAAERQRTEPFCRWCSEGEPIVRVNLDAQFHERGRCAKTLPQPSPQGEPVRQLKVWTVAEAIGPSSPFEYDHDDIVLVSFDDLVDTVQPREAALAQPAPARLAPKPSCGWVSATNCRDPQCPAHGSASAQPAPSALSRIHDEIDAESQPAPETTQPTEFWSVSVERNGEPVVTLESHCLSGRDLSEEDERVIKTAARHLLAFLGQPAPSEIAALVESLCVSLHDAHNELLRLQGITEGLDRYDWPEWSGPANSIRHAERLLGKPLSKTSLRAADAPLAPEPEQETK